MKVGSVVRGSAVSRVVATFVLVCCSACGGQTETAASDGPADDGVAATAATAPASIDEVTGGPIEPELVGAGVISTPDGNQTFPAEDPRTGDLWISVYSDDFDEQTIMVSRRTASGWSMPEVAPFSGRWGDRAPRFDPGGTTLYFTSNRPRSPEAEPGDMNIWRVVRAGDTWSAPELVPGAVNSPARDIHMAVTDSGLWFASAREGGFGRSDVYRVSRSDPGFAFHLPAPVNDSLSQPDVWVSADESWMILVITDHPSGHGGDDLYVLRRDGDGWTSAVNAGPRVNSPDYEYGPTLSRDGQHILFASHRGENANVYRVPVAELRALIR
ncbi:MAG TPA: hypothetical protein VMM79_01755 [Longimicrobiales bacterium]|nr:hypothetical protein [Longimicrobiales bacterium]